jgi:hypothetical protein
MRGDPNRFNDQVLGLRATRTKLHGDSRNSVQPSNFQNLMPPTGLTTQTEREVELFT